jgi:hypothetical protein
VDEQFADVNQNSQSLLTDININPMDNQSNEMSESKTNEQEIRQLNNLALEIASHYDRYQHQLVYNKDLAANSAKSIVNATSEKLSQMYQLLERVQMNCSYMESRYLKFSEFYKSAVSCYERLEKMDGPNIPNKLAQIDEVRNVFHSRRTNSEFLFEEIRDLTLWYTYFITSYCKLLLEVDRRNRAQKEQAILIEKMRQELHNQIASEEQSRLLFFEEHGKYLPASLCPAIMEPCTKFTIIPERALSNLPSLELSSSEIEELSKEISTRDHEQSVQLQQQQQNNSASSEHQATN